MTRQLFETAPDPKPKKPTKPQLRFLHVLRDNLLEISDRPFQNTWLKKASGEIIFFTFHPTVLQNVLLNGWAKMDRFDRHKAIYRISREGRHLLKELCDDSEHKWNEEIAELLAGHLVCRKCALSVRCQSKQPTRHEANRRHWKYGPICDICFQFLASKA